MCFYFWVRGVRCPCTTSSPNTASWELWNLLWACLGFFQLYWQLGRILCEEVLICSFWAPVATHVLKQPEEVKFITWVSSEVFPYCFFFSCNQAEATKMYLRNTLINLTDSFVVQDFLTFKKAWKWIGRSIGTKLNCWQSIQLLQ